MTYTFDIYFLQSLITSPVIIFQQYMLLDDMDYSHILSLFSRIA